MHQNYPNYFQTQQQPIPRVPQLGLKGRPVSSLDEVRGTSIDFDGSVFFFPDLANKRIYTKQINMDGTASLNVYELDNTSLNQMTPMNSSNFITREEYEATISQIHNMLEQYVNSNHKMVDNTNIATQF